MIFSKDKLSCCMLVSQFLVWNQLELDTIKLLPILFSTGLGKLSQADEYLAQAEWTVLKSPDTVDSIKSKLYRNIGLLHAAKGNYEAALRLLSEDVRTLHMLIGCSKFMIFQMYTYVIGGLPTRSRFLHCIEHCSATSFNMIKLYVNGISSMRR